MGGNGPVARRVNTELKTPPRVAGPPRLVDLDTVRTGNAEVARELEGKCLDAVRLRAGVETVLTSRDKARGSYVVGDASGDVVGVPQVTYERSQWRNGTFWWLNNVFVSPRWRRRAVYTAMYGLAEGLDRADKSVCDIRLFTGAENHAARRTYDGVGMRSEANYVCETDFAP